MTRTEVEGEVARGDKVILRTKRRNDAEAEYAWRRDPELASYDAVKPISTAYEDFLALYEDDLSQPTPFRRSFAVDDMAGRHIGNVMFYNIDLLKREAEVGITIGDRDYWNCGYGADAMTALVGHIFTNTALTRLYLKTLDWNVRAQHSFANAGFVRYGTSRRSNGTFILMEMHRGNWEARGHDHADLPQTT
jgi:RimJ/RimL family protein N-acetyltransferase